MPKMDEFGRCCVAAIVLLTLNCYRVQCSPLITVLSGETDQCFHDCSIKDGFCENGGTCQKLNPICSATSYNCLCPSGFIGSRCHIVDEPCKYDQLFTDLNCHCENGAICRKIGDECVASSYTCDCNAGYEGVLCENPIPIHVLELNTTVMSTEPSTTPTTTSAKPSSVTTEGASVASSPGIVSDKDVPTGNVSSPFTVSPVINANASLAEDTPTNDTTLSPQTTQSPKQSTLPETLARMESNLLCDNCVHGQCSENETNGECMCDQGYYGQYCDSKCLKECINGGICIHSQGVESCQCAALYEGEFCETNITIPLAIKEHVLPTSNTKKHMKRFCSNNFECINGVCNGSDHRHPKCICDDGFIGTFCETKCVKKCLNGGQCVIVSDTEKCNCPHGYQGLLCEKQIDPSHAPKSMSPAPDIQNTTKDTSMHCINGFKCIHGVCDKTVPDHPVCMCDEGYIGDFCHQECSLKCINNAACITSDNEQICRCTFGFEGTFCERKISSEKVISEIPKTTQIPTIPPPLKTRTTTTLAIAFFDFFRNIVKEKGKGEMRDPSNGLCINGLKCVHGVCDKTVPDHPVCNCDLGYIGDFCHRECSLKCVNNGKCLLVGTIQLCNCKSGFKGRLCERSVLKEASIR